MVCFLTEKKNGSEDFRFVFVIAYLLLTRRRNTDYHHLPSNKYPSYFYILFFHIQNNLLNKLKEKTEMHKSKIFFGVSKYFPLFCILGNNRASACSFEVHKKYFTKGILCCVTAKLDSTLD